MEHAGKAIFHALKRVAEEEKPLDFLAAVWPLVVGARMAEHTRPVAWQKGRVEIAVSDREWQKQLERMGTEVRQQINKWWGVPAVQEVSFVRARGTRSQERHPAKSEARLKSAAAADSTIKVEVILKDFEESLAGIKDKNLRKLVSRVAQKYLEPQEK